MQGATNIADIELAMTNPVVTNARIESSSPPQEESNPGGNRPMLRPDSSAWSVQSGTETNAEKVARDVKELGGWDALERVFDLRQELVSTEDERKVVDANGDELPITVREAVRCRSIVDEVGLLRIISSIKKVNVSKGGWQLKALLLVSLGIFICYLVIINELTGKVPSDNGLGACLEDESVNAMRDMRMSTQTGFCTNADCTETMNATFVEIPWTNATYNAAQDACDVYYEQNTPWIVAATLIPYTLAFSTLYNVMFRNRDLIRLLKRNEDSDPMVLMAPKAMINIGSLFLRFVLIAFYSNRYTDSSVTLFVDLFLLFVFAEIVDYLFSLISKPFFNAVKGEIKEFDEAYMMMEKESRGFVFEQKEGSRDLPKVKLDDNATIHPAYLPKNDDGSKGELVGYYFTSAGARMIELRQCLPWKFGSNYSSTLNGRWKIHTRKDESVKKERHALGMICEGCKCDPIRDVHYTKGLLFWLLYRTLSLSPSLSLSLCQTCFDEAISENSEK
ncbi:hypothetical protein TrST_g8666 [Triparma strigata]|uniref:Uncharacterized protein n=1 Tax=Triparma strigata TaxID=1606541 RepID=A0A9W7B2W1_9STRA|nr:hypothetical protein TrST_g8666 [Triparma strigata]